MISNINVGYIDISIMKIDMLWLIPVIINTDNDKNNDINKPLSILIINFDNAAATSGNNYDNTNDDYDS